MIYLLSAQGKEHDRHFFSFVFTFTLLSDGQEKQTLVILFPVVIHADFLRYLINSWCDLH